MSAITFALNEIKFRVPLPILKEAFKDDVLYFNSSNVSLDEQIKNKVIKPRVLPICNVVGGQQIIVDLFSISPSYIDPYIIIYEIPSNRLANREIVSALSVTFSPSTLNMPFQQAANNVSSMYGGNFLTKEALSLCEGLSPIPNISNAIIELIGHNTVLIREASRSYSYYQLRCLVSNDPNLNNIQVRSRLKFTKLVELAVKSYIYNTLYIKIDRGYIEGGQEIGAFKQLIETYSDSEQMLQDYVRDEWTEVAAINDTLTHDRIIKLQIPSSL